MDLWRVLLTLALVVSSNTFSGSWGESSFPFLTCGVREQRKLSQFLEQLAGNLS